MHRFCTPDLNKTTGAATPVFLVNQDGSARRRDEYNWTMANP